MIYGIGTDIVDINRIDKIYQQFGDHFLQRCFCHAEILPHYSAAHYAKRFAAKEAVLKAIGVGLRKGITWHDIEITKTDFNKPTIKLFGKAHEYLLEKINNPAYDYNYNIHLSLSDEPPFAIAFVIISIVS